MKLITVLVSGTFFINATRIKREIAFDFLPKQENVISNFFGLKDRLFAEQEKMLINECDAKLRGPCTVEEVREIYDTATKEEIKKKWLEKYHTCTKHECSAEGTVRKEERPFHSCRCICKFGFYGNECDQSVDLVKLYKTKGINIADPNTNNAIEKPEFDDIEKDNGKKDGSDDDNDVAGKIIFDKSND